MCVCETREGSDSANVVESSSTRGWGERGPHQMLDGYVGPSRLAELTLCFRRALRTLSYRFFFLGNCSSRLPKPNYSHGEWNNLDVSPSESVNAVIASGSAPVKHTFPVDVNDFHS